jgi:hypothetical protein
MLDDSFPGKGRGAQTGQIYFVPYSVILPSTRRSSRCAREVTWC